MINAAVHAEPSDRKFLIIANKTLSSVTIFTHLTNKLRNFGKYYSYLPNKISLFAIFRLISMQLTQTLNIW